MSEFKFDGLCTPFTSESWQEQERRRKERENADKLRDVLAESTAADVSGLRLALARIVVLEDGVRSYGGGCHCSGRDSCSGHVPEVMKVARTALGLPHLPDTPRVLTPPEPKKKKKRKRKKVA